MFDLYTRYGFLQIAAKVSLLLDSLTKETTEECRRVGAWAVLSQPTGARLVKPGTTQAVLLYARYCMNTRAEFKSPRCNIISLLNIQVLIKCTVE